MDPLEEIHDALDKIRERRKAEAAALQGYGLGVGYGGDTLRASEPVEPGNMDLGVDRVPALVIEIEDWRPVWRHKWGCCTTCCHTAITVLHESTVGEMECGECGHFTFGVFDDANEMRTKHGLSILSE